MRGYIDLKKLNLEELVGVVNLYPWFGGARKELGARIKYLCYQLSLNLWCLKLPCGL